jgi:hypothetical protein
MDHFFNRLPTTPIVPATTIPPTGILPISIIPFIIVAGMFLPYGGYLRILRLRCGILVPRSLEMFNFESFGN